MRRLFLIGTQGIPADYGGLETFAQEVTTRLASRGWPVWVSCEVMPGGSPGPSEFRGVNLFYVHGPDNVFRTPLNDASALRRCAELAQRGDVVYLQGYAVGPFASRALRKFHRRGIEFWMNPDGLEWQRPRWPWYIRQYLRFAEGHLLRRADRVICDAAAIREHHGCVYGIPEERMEVIEYGAPLVRQIEDPELLARRDEYLSQYDLEPGEYLTYVGRFVPDNNMELMIRGVLDDRIRRRLLVLAAHRENDPFYRLLRELVDSSPRPDKVVFTGGVYDQPLLGAIRLGEFAYLHGHEVGGTNPALVEAMGLGSLIAALGTVYNREVLAEAGVFFEKDPESFIDVVQRLEALGPSEVEALKEKARDRVREHYNWERITDEYERLLLAGSSS